MTCSNVKTIKIDIKKYNADYFKSYLNVEKTKLDFLEIPKIKIRVCYDLKKTPDFKLWEMRVIDKNQQYYKLQINDQEIIKNNNFGFQINSVYILKNHEMDVKSSLIQITKNTQIEQISEDNEILKERGKNIQISTINSSIEAKNKPRFNQYNFLVYVLEKKNDIMVFGESKNLKQRFTKYYIADASKCKLTLKIYEDYEFECEQGSVLYLNHVVLKEKEVGDYNILPFPNSHISVNPGINQELDLRDLVKNYKGEYTILNKRDIAYHRGHIHLHNIEEFNKVLNEDESVYLGKFYRFYANIHSIFPGNSELTCVNENCKTNTLSSVFFNNINAWGWECRTCKKLIEKPKIKYNFFIFLRDCSTLQKFLLDDNLLTLYFKLDLNIVDEYIFKRTEESEMYIKNHLEKFNYLELNFYLQIFSQEKKIINKIFFIDVIDPKEQLKRNITLINQLIN